MTALDLRLTPEIAVAADAAGRKAGLSRHAWIIATLDRAAGIDAPPNARDPRPPERRRARGTRVKLWLLDDRRRAYETAAERACLPIAQWASVVVGIAAGESKLAEQVRRLGGN